MGDMKGQLTLRGVVIGCIGCAIISASSVYVALKMGALPWPIIFAAIVSLFFLRLISRGKASLNEANVSHTVMSSGAMIAGGLAFTIPGAWMLGLGDQIGPVQLIVIALCGSALGIIGCIMLRRHFVEDVSLEYPIGTAAAETLRASSPERNTGKKVFLPMGLAAIYCMLRDAFHVIPSMLAALPIPGVAFGIYNSPMMLSVGFLVGAGSVIVWFIGALIGNFAIIVGAPALGICGLEAAQQATSCLGMGCMMGCGIAVIVKDIIPKGASAISAAMGRTLERNEKMGVAAAGFVRPAKGSEDPARANERRRFASAILLIAAIVAMACIFLGLPLAVSMALVLFAFVACAMSAQSVGQTGIDPMEIFGLIALLLISLFADISEVRLFFIAAVVAVACGLAGDVMNDFKAGAIIGTNPKAQWVGQSIGAAIGCVVSVGVMVVLFNAYGADAFGQGKEFVAAQASVVAAMVSGIPNIWMFALGLGLGFLLYLVRFPSMMLGLGIYLPFYMSFTAFLGCLVKLVIDAIFKMRSAKLDEEEREQKGKDIQEDGLLIATGLLGGESVMGIILALVSSISLLAM